MNELKKQLNKCLHVIINKDHIIWVNKIDISNQYKILIKFSDGSTESWTWENKSYRDEVFDAFEKLINDDENIENNIIYES